MPRRLARWRVAPGRIVEDEDPVELFARVGRVEPPGPGVRELADPGRLSVARIEPPRPDVGPLDLLHADRERAAHGCVDHGITAPRVAGGDEPLQPGARDR